MAYLPGDPGRWWPLPIYLAGVAGALSPARRAALGVAGVALLVAALGWINGRDALFVVGSAVWIALSAPCSWP